MNYDAETIAKTLYPRPVRYYAQVGSTNDIALGWLREGADTGAVVIADEQVQGRGRLGRAWQAPPGTSVMLSVVLRPTPEGLAQLTMLGALVVCEMIESFDASADVGLKWPNDVQIGGKKVCGVLPEAAWQSDKLQGAVLGMGVNVRVDFSGSSLADKATSMEPALGISLDRLAVLKALLAQVDHWSALLGSDALFDAWRARLRTLGTQVQVNDVRGTAESVDDSGALMVRQEDGSLTRVVAGDIVMGNEA